MYEHRSEPLLSPRQFVRRLITHGLAAAGLLSLSLAVGVLGYHLTEGMSWVDSLLNAAMLLGGMGQINPLRTDAGKLFASAYALFAGVIFLATAGILVAPVAHRLAHRLHLEAEAAGR
jgi:hypothetical protein